MADAFALVALDLVLGRPDLAQAVLEAVDLGEAEEAWLGRQVGIVRRLKEELAAGQAGGPGPPPPPAETLEQAVRATLGPRARLIRSSGQVAIEVTYDFDDPDDAGRLALIEGLPFTLEPRRGRLAIVPQGDPAGAQAVVVLGGIWSDKLEFELEYALDDKVPLVGIGYLADPTPDGGAYFGLVVDQSAWTGAIARSYYLSLEDSASLGTLAASGVTGRDQAGDGSMPRFEPVLLNRETVRLRMTWLSRPKPRHVLSLSQAGVVRRTIESSDPRRTSGHLALVCSAVSDFEIERVTVRGVPAPEWLASFER